MALKEGQQAPAFSLPGNDGKQHDLEDFNGAKLLIFFYPKDNTPGCTKEACGFKDIYREILDLGVQLLGVSKDSLASHEKFSAKYNLPVSTALGSRHKNASGLCGMGRKEALRQDFHRLYPFDRSDRRRRNGCQTLGQGHQSCRPPTAGITVPSGINQWPVTPPCNSCCCN